MTFETFKTEGGTIQAKGTDINGSFTLNGTINPATNQIRFDKLYHN
jgi:hypothetical protein